MSDIPLSQEEIARQVRQHTDSLRAAGIDWLPNGPAIVTMATPAPDLTSEPEPIKSLPLVTESLQTIQASLLTADSGDGLSPEQRRAALVDLTRKVAQCTRCAGLASTRTQTVFGVGPLDPDLCFIGEAPGADEDRQGEPFVGAAGQLLNRIIEACGMKREEVFICNIIRCRPPGNRQPQPDEAANCKEYLEKTLELVQPKYICALGATALKYLTGTNLSVSKLRGRFLDYNGIPVMVTYHPAYLLPSRNPAAKRDVWEDMKRLLTKMGKPIPGAK
jgi:DNA polymerase